MTSYIENSGIHLLTMKLSLSVNEALGYKHYTCKSDISSLVASSIAISLTFFFFVIYTIIHIEQQNTSRKQRQMHCELHSKRRIGEKKEDEFIYTFILHRILLIQEISDLTEWNVNF